jgi:hypothetical protein
MSIWISKGAVAALLLVLAACVPGLPDLGTSSSRSMPVMGGAIQVAAAPGYCVDRQASRETDAQAVVIIGRCSDRSGSLPAIVTVAVGAPGSAASLTAGPEALAQFFASEDGRATLGRDGDAASVSIRDIRTVDGRLILHLDDAATGETWRTLFGLRGRLVSVSVSATTGRGQTGAAGRTLLDMSTTAMIRSNPAAP